MTSIDQTTIVPNDLESELYTPFFPEEEYEQRLVRLREKMAQQGLDGCLVSTPENIYYLTGLNHWGFFAFHLLIVPAEGKPTLIARKMETVTIENQLAERIYFSGYTDQQNPARFSVDELKRLGLSTGRLGIDFDCLYRSHADTQVILSELASAEWHQVDGLVRELRMIKSSREVEAIRQAGIISERMTEAAYGTAKAGASEKEIAAEVYRAMILAGGEPPSFGPFLRPKKRLGEEHTTWSNGFLSPGDILFSEVAGSYHRYHAPMGRVIFVGEPPKGTEEIQTVCLSAFDAVTATLRPGVTADTVYQSWQGVVNDAGLGHYQRHHCGYMVGISFPPSWMEGTNCFISLRKGSDLVIKEGMTFHVMSWLMGTGQGDFFTSNTVAVTASGCEVLTGSSQELLIV